MFLNGTGSAQKADVIERVFRTTACACDARCDVTPNMPYRMRWTKMVKVTTPRNRRVTAFPNPLGAARGAKGKRQKWYIALRISRVKERYAQSWDKKGNNGNVAALLRPITSKGEREDKCERMPRWSDI